MLVLQLYKDCLLIAKFYGQRVRGCMHGDAVECQCGLPDLLCSDVYKAQDTRACLNMCSKAMRRRSWNKYAGSSRPTSMSLMRRRSVPCRIQCQRCSVVSSYDVARGSGSLPAAFTKHAHHHTSCVAAHDTR